MNEQQRRVRMKADPTIEAVVLTAMSAALHDALDVLRAENAELRATNGRLTAGIELARDERDRADGELRSLRAAVARWHSENECQCQTWPGATNDLHDLVPADGSWSAPREEGTQQ